MKIDIKYTLVGQGNCIFGFQENQTLSRPRIYNPSSIAQFHFIGEPDIILGRL